MTNNELYKMLQTIYEKEMKNVKSFENDKNPQIVELYTKAKAETELLEDIIDALKGNQAYLKIRIQ